MKTKIAFITVILLMAIKYSYGDVILENTHHVSKCVKITNIDDYPDVCFLVYVNEVMSYPTYIVSSSDCLTKGYKYNVLNLLAVNKSYMSGKDMSKINWLKDAHALPSNIRIDPEGGYVDDSIPISGIDEYYKVVGFSNTNVILYKWKQVTKYNNGKPDLIENFEYVEPVTPIYQKIMVGINSSDKPSNIEVFPNPANKNIHLRIIDSYSGAVSVELVATTGKVVQSFNLSKQSSILNKEIPLTNVAKGAYLVKVQMGKDVEYKKVLIK
ncbi:MAG: T9SS type A sorting domain-containing protein [Methylococcaceae bacterium]|nr:T9SS type A sorting domain-containing protein [Prolixibacteraceae bacterium]